MSLDALRSEIATKRKLATDDNAKPSKYMRRGELEKLKEEQEKEERQKKEASRLQASESSKHLAESKVRFLYNLLGWLVLLKRSLDLPVIKVTHAGKRWP